MGWRTRLALLLPVVLAAGCDGEDENARETAADSATVVAAPRVEPLTDAEALGVLLAISSGAAEAARAPAEVVAMPELRRLVNVVRADHEALRAELTEIADSLQLTPAEHAAVARVRAATQSAVSGAAQLAWGSADQPVLQQQLNLQTLLLTVLDSTVLPALRPSLLQQYATAARPTVAAHLQRARQLEVLLASAPRPAPVTTPAAPRASPTPAAEARVDTTPPPPPPDTGRAGRR